MNEKRKIRNDIIFIVALLAVAAVAGLLFFLFREDGDRVVVTVDGDVMAEYPLSKDAEVDIRTGREEEQLNRLVIKDGQAFIERATCPDGICAAHSPIHRDGESIVCLPHKVVVTVSTSEGEAPDVIV